jgi:hypothetical protein
VETGHPLHLARGRYGVRLGHLGVGEVGKGVQETPSRGWQTPYLLCGRENGDEKVALPH